MVKKQSCVILVQIYIKTDDVYKDIAEDVETWLTPQIMN